MSRAAFSFAALLALAVTAQAASAPPGLPKACRDSKGADDAKVILAGCTETAQFSAEKRAWQRYYRGYAYVERGEFKAAAKELKLAIAIAPQIANFHHEYAYVLIELGDYDAAESSAAKAIDLDPNDLSHKQERGYARMLKGDYQGSADDYAIMLADGQNDVARAIRGYVLAMSGNLMAARAEVAKLPANAQGLVMQYRDLANAVLATVQPADDAPASVQSCAEAFGSKRLEAKVASTCTWAIRHATTPAERAIALRARSLIWYNVSKLNAPATTDAEAAVRLAPKDARTVGQRCSILRDTARTALQKERAAADCKRALSLCGEDKTCAAELGHLVKP